MNKKATLLATGLIACSMQIFGQQAPEPCGLTPSERQIEL